MEYRNFLEDLFVFCFRPLNLELLSCGWWVAPLILLSAKVQIYFIPLNLKVFPNSYQYWTSTFEFRLLGLTIFAKM